MSGGLKNPRWHSVEVEKVTDRWLHRICKLFDAMKLSPEEKQQRLEVLAVDVIHVFECAEAKHKPDIGLEVLDEGQLRNACLAISKEILCDKEEVAQAIASVDEAQPFLRIRHLRSWRERLEEKKIKFVAHLQDLIRETSNAASITGNECPLEFRNIHYQG